MIEIDGPQKSGSGTILRLSIVFITILRTKLHIYTIRENKAQPDLLAQHLEAVFTAQRLCAAELKRDFS
jgi:RNA 3'-terminal phosphate cyclase